jgi:hypothetical protein
MLGTRRLPGSPLILAGVAVVALVAGAGVAMAATSGSRSPSAAPASSSGQIAATPVPSAPPGPGWAGAHRPGLRFGLGGGLFGAVHGQFVVPRSGGGYQTIDTQRGAVTAVNATSITIRSSDGFTKTYQVTSSTHVDAQQNGIGSVKAGHQAIVLATVSGSTATAARILDLSLLPAFHGGPGGPGWHFGAPANGAPANGAPATGGVG